MVVRRVERDKQILLQQHSKTALLRSLRNQQEAVLLCDTAMSGWPILFTNKSCNDMLGLDENTLGGRGIWDLFKMDAGSKVYTCHLLCCVACIGCCTCWQLMHCLRSTGLQFQVAADRAVNVLVLVCCKQT